MCDNKITQESYSDALKIHRILKGDEIKSVSARLNSYELLDGYYVTRRV